MQQASCLTGQIERLEAALDALPEDEREAVIDHVDRIVEMTADRRVAILTVAKGDV